MYRVLIVDDEPIIRKGLRETIEWDSLGLEISGEACNGAEALTLIKANQPHILITDIRMPGMDGITLVKTIRDLGFNIKIIILSGFSDYAFLKEAIRLGVESYLLKPIDNDELISNLVDSVNNIEKEILHAAQLSQGIELLTSNTLNRLVTNAIGRSEFEEKAAFLDIALTAEHYLCAVCIEKEVNGGVLGYGEPLVAFTILSICNVLAEGLGFSFIDDKNRVVLLFSGDREEEMCAAANGVLENAVKQALENFGISIVTNVGIIVKTTEDIWKSYASATDRFDRERVTDEVDQLDRKWSTAVDRTIAYIAAHYHEALTLKQIACICDINTSYLGQIFKKRTGESFTNYVNNYRIEKAKELLSHSSLKVYEIAEKVGFTDYRYFLKIFKKITGVIPTETRS